MLRSMTDPVISPRPTPRRATSSSAAARARGLPVARHVHPAARGAEGEELSIDVAVLGPCRRARGAAAHLGDARRRRVLRLRLPGRISCTTTHSSRRGGRRRARRVPARAQSLRLLASAPHQRGQRRPQPQLSRFLDAAAAQRAPTPRCTASSCRRRGRRRRRTRRGSAPTSQRMASARCRRR